MKKTISYIILLLLVINSYSQQWISFEEDSLDSNVRSFYPDDSLLYVGGSFHFGGTLSLMGAGIWNNVQWDSMESGVNVGAGGIYCFTKYKNKLYAGGGF